MQNGAWLAAARCASQWAGQPHAGIYGVSLGVSCQSMETAEKAVTEEIPTKFRFTSKCVYTSGSAIIILTYPTI